LRRRRRRRGALLRGPVKYRVTHSLRLPAAVAHHHSLTRAVYLQHTGTIVALLDRGDDAVSLVTTVAAESFHVIDELAMAAREVLMCAEPLSTAWTDAVVVGTAVQPRKAMGEPTAGCCMCYRSALRRPRA
ncbi:hypothetical protein DQ04_24031000, partial [Trypanosoma grayi]|uniref:hypothetical protein n=1 Tax=Trypanosoma grayi TaxID=71804 RepID=UPI0004F476C6